VSCCTVNGGFIVRISSGGSLITILTNFGGYKTFRLRLTKYCRGCVSSIPGGVDAYGLLVPLHRLFDISTGTNTLVCSSGYDHVYVVVSSITWNEAYGSCAYQVRVR